MTTRIELKASPKRVFFCNIAVNSAFRFPLLEHDLFLKVNPCDFWSSNGNLANTVRLTGVMGVFHTDPHDEVVLTTLEIKETP
jgi:hypothetical protein